MSFKRKLEYVFSLFCMAVTAMALMATSYHSISIYEGSFYLSSDCVQPIVETQSIETQGGLIVEPNGASFEDYGFPTEKVSLITDNVGSVGGANRNCRTTYGDTKADENIWVFSCYDNEEFVCTIVIEKP